MYNQKLRPRRMRITPAMRAMVRETTLSAKDFVYPIFVVPGEHVKEEIPSMPNCYHLSVDNAVELAKEIAALGIPAVEVFGLPEYKDADGSSAWDPTSPVQRAIKAIKAAVPELMIVGDVCLCQYTTHGHCGHLEGHYVDNDKTLKLLQKVAVSQAEAGADIIAPSDMMDGRVAAIREALDEHGFQNVSIMSYAVKYASGYYGPFRDAADSARWTRPMRARRLRKSTSTSWKARTSSWSSRRSLTSTSCARSATTSIIQLLSTMSAASTRWSRPPQQTAGSTRSASCSRR